MTNYSGIIDTHAHYLDRAFEEDRSLILETQKNNGVAAIIENAVDVPSCSAALALSESTDIVYAAVGIHPEDIEGLPEDWLEKVAGFAGHPRAVAIGEIGLDYHWDTPRDLQHEVFTKQLELAADLGMPVEIHDREAHGDIIDIIRRYRPSGCLHRFSGSLEMAQEAVKAGLVLGIGGALTYKNSKKEKAAVRELPLDCFILETDCPYLSPAGFRGQRCTSDMISLVIEEMAALTGETPEKIIEVTSTTARRVFRLP